MNKGSSIIQSNIIEICKDLAIKSDDEVIVLIVEGWKNLILQSPLLAIATCRDSIRHVW